MTSKKSKSFVADIFNTNWLFENQNICIGDEIKFGDDILSVIVYEIDSKAKTLTTIVEFDDDEIQENRINLGEGLPSSQTSYYRRGRSFEHYLDFINKSK